MFFEVDFFPQCTIIADHPTEVATVALGSVIGVASQARYRMVRVANNCSPTGEGPGDLTLIGAINQVRDNAAFRKNQGRAAVALFSTAQRNVGTAVNDALTNMVDFADIPLIVAGGQLPKNLIDGGLPRDHMQYFPQRHPRALNVGYTNSNDYKVRHNQCQPFGGGGGIMQFTGLDIFAPAGPKYNSIDCAAQPIQLGIPVGLANGGYSVDSGSSFAAPQAAGVAAQMLSQVRSYYQKENQVRRTIVDMGSVAAGHIEAGDPNRVLYDMLNAMPAVTNSASFAEPVASDSLGTAFGAFSLFPNRVFLEFDPEGSGQLELTILGSSTLSQVNFFIPSGVPKSETGSRHFLKVFRDSSLLGQVTILNRNISPGIFTNNQQGTGVANALLYKFSKATGELQEIVGSQNNFNWDPNTQDAFLVVFCTGLRNGFNFQASLGGSYLPEVQYAGETPGFLGLDQVNLGPLDPAIRFTGARNVTINVDGKNTNVPFVIFF